MNPRVSILIPISCRHKWLYDCIRSATQQSYKDLEVIVICSRLIYIELSRFFKNLKWIDDTGAMYAGDKRNLGIVNCSGDFIFFLDSDDLIYSPTTISDLVDRLIDKHYHYNVVGGSCLIFDNRINKLIKRNDLVVNKNRITVFKNFQLETGFYRFIYNKEFLIQNKLFFPSAARFQDCIFLVNVLMKANYFLLINSDIYIYRKHHKQLLWTCKMFTDHLHGVMYLLDVAHNNKYKRLELRMLKNICFTFLTRQPILGSFYIRYTTTFRAFFLTIYELVKIFGANRRVVESVFRTFVCFLKGVLN